VAQGLELIAVDYLQLMEHSRKGMSPYEHASEVSTGLKAFAKAEDLTVMAVAQLSRDLELRPDKRPMPSDHRVRRTAGGHCRLSSHEKRLRATPFARRDCRNRPERPRAGQRRTLPDSVDGRPRRDRHLLALRRQKRTRPDALLLVDRYKETRVNDQAFGKGARVGDGPYRPDRLSEKFLDRVVGILQPVFAEPMRIAA
jgi:hypothetical protein